MKSQARRQIFLAEMGLGPIWTSTLLTAQDDALLMQEAPSEAIPDSSSTLPVQPAQDSLAESEVSDTPLSSLATNTDGGDISRMDWEQLEHAVSECTRCDLCRSRTKTVFGKGNRQARWLFVGEGPGRQEDLQGIPFIGPAGKLLANMLRAIDLDDTRDVFITNIVKCRPTDAKGKDRSPTPEEAQACQPYLQRQIELLAPEVMMALGKTAALSLLELPAETPVGSLRGTTYHYRNIPLVVTYHPAYLLRKLSDKGKAWSDLCLAASHDV